MIANLDLQTLHISVKARLDVAKLNLMLSSDCSQIGTGSSNSPRSANESAFFAYNLEMAENLRVTRRRAVDGEPESASLRAIRQIPRIFLRAQKSWFGLRIGRENSAL